MPTIPVNMAIEAEKKRKHRQMIRIPIAVGIITFLIETPMFILWGNIMNIWPNFMREVFISLRPFSEATEFIYWFRPPFDFVGLIILSIIIIQGIWNTRSKMKDRDIRDNIIFAVFPSLIYALAAMFLEGYSIFQTSAAFWSTVICLFILIIICFAPTKGLTWTIVLSHAILLSIGTLIVGFLPALCWVLPLMVIQHSVRAIKSIKIKKIWLYLSGE